jgi:hypothetical protein
VYIWAKIECVYQDTFITLKITKNGFYESWLSYKGENAEKLARSENLNLNSRGDINYTKAVKRDLLAVATKKKVSNRILNRQV